MQRNQYSCEEQFVFFFERKSKSVDYGAKDFQQLCNSVEPLCFVDELEKDIVDRPPYVGS